MPSDCEFIQSSFLHTLYRNVSPFNVYYQAVTQQITKDGNGL
ncbi:hypothetical protein MTsDn5_15520 [Alteromonas gracilis]